MKLKYFPIVKVKLQNVFPWPIFAIFFAGFTQCSNPRKAEEEKIKNQIANKMSIKNNFNVAFLL